MYYVSHILESHENKESQRVYPIFGAWEPLKSFVALATPSARRQRWRHYPWTAVRALGSRSNTRAPNAGQHTERERASEIEPRECNKRSFIKSSCCHLPPWADQRCKKCTKTGSYRRLFLATKEIALEVAWWLPPMGSWLERKFQKQWGHVRTC